MSLPSTLSFPPARRAGGFPPAGLGLALAALLVLFAAPAARAQFVYGLTIDGKLALNGTVLDKLPSGYSSGSATKTEERWWALDVVGPNRWALRLDGRLFKNGKKLFDLPFSSFAFLPFWVALDAVGEDVHTLSQAGLRAKNGVAVVNYAETDQANKAWPFSAILAPPDGLPTNGAVLALRSDGAVFAGTGVDLPALKFTAGAGPFGALDGESDFTAWVDLALDPLTGDVVALRADGKLYAAGLDFQDPDGMSIASLPIAPSPTNAGRYTKLGFAGDGSTRVLRRDGAVFDLGFSLLVPLMVYPGDGISDGELFLSFTFLGDDQYAVRSDGRVYRNDVVDKTFFKLPGSDYRVLAISEDLPDLTSFKNPQPKVARYAIKTVEGHAVTAPVLATDIELLPQQLDVSPNGDLPEGVSLDEVPVVGGGALHELSVASAGPVGKTVTKLFVTDGVTKPVKVAYPVVVKALDTDPLKNRKPLVSKLKLVQALVGFETVIPILADDEDEDPLTYTVNEAKYPFTAGATFGLEDGQPVFRWTPAFEDLGKTSFQVTVSDGIAKRKLTVKLKVVGSLVISVPAGD